MKKRKLVQNGQIDAKGQLRFYVDALKDWARQFRNEKIIITYEVLPKEQSKLLRAYYFNYVVKEFQQAIKENGEHLTFEQTEQRMRESAPMLEVAHYDFGRCLTRYTTKEVDELSNEEFAEYIEFLKEYAAENYNIYIEDPNVETTQKK